MPYGYFSKSRPGSETPSNTPTPESSGLRRLKLRRDRQFLRDAGLLLNIGHGWGNQNKKRA
jgi:hypothetical protein